MRIVITTFPDVKTARQIGTLLVESQLAACINLVPGVESIYQWEGKVNQDNEILGIIKTIDSHLEALETKLMSEHPYDTPELLVISPLGGSESYLKWVWESCLQEKP